MGFTYFKANPTEYARIRGGGKIRREGEGIAGFYLPFHTTIEMLSMATHDQPFAFQEYSSDNQELTIQGGFIYRIAKPTQTLARYDFSIDPRTKRYLTDDRKKLADHILQL